MSTRQKFWVANGNAAVRRYVRDCDVCAIERATPIGQLMSDLPLARLATHKHPFLYSGVDYLGPLNYAKERSNKMAWGLLFTYMASRGIHVKLVTSLSMDDFCLPLLDLQTCMDRTMQSIQIMQVRSKLGQKAPLLD